MPIWLKGRRTPGPAHLVVDDELGDGIGIEAPRTWPVGSHVAGGGELTRRGIGIGVQPGPEPGARRMIVFGKGEVHNEAA